MRKEYTPAVGDDVCIVSSGASLSGTDYVRGTVTRILKRYLEITTKKGVTKMLPDGKDLYPADRGPWRSTWHHLEPWEPEIENRKAVAGARTFLRYWSCPQNLEDGKAIELAKILREFK